MGDNSMLSRQNMRKSSAADLDVKKGDGLCRAFDQVMFRCSTLPFTPSFTYVEAESNSFSLTQQKHYSWI